ncbi:hypothetical protein VP1G_07642 [Cytospora mali]|uniref:Uncharacterized protein n=1 Tax=Cytospora mali TaxID=578113 RepID=A0A194V8V3_CYTMA|nr:hypothetical protein VP1G_07642 [Valsa mali var. pyri (nom. inval.)]
MQFSSIFLAAATALFAGSQAASIPRQSDPHIVDFRTYGQPGCSADNQGVYTYTESQLNTCYTFSESTVESIFVVDVTEGCSVYAYTDTACSVNQITVPVGIDNCYDNADGLGSYEVVC